MKKVFSVFAFLAFAQIALAQQATPAASTENAVFAWTDQSHDFGKIKQGVPVSHEFRFTNKGKVPLVIASAQASCGCTTPDWTKDPVPPGQSGFIKATFNAAAPGMFDKTISVTANVDGGPVMLKLKGEVSAQVP